MASISNPAAVRHRIGRGGTRLASRALLAGAAVIVAGCASRVPPPPALAVDGRCGAAAGVCLLGVAAPLDDGGETLGWRCVGLNGGGTGVCPAAPPSPSPEARPRPVRAGRDGAAAVRRAEAPPARGRARNRRFSRADPEVVQAAEPATVPDVDVSLRRRVVAMDAGMLARARESVARGTEAPAVVTLNLFDDVVHEGLIEWTAPTFSGGYSISGRLADDPLGTVTLVVNGDVVAGTVRTLGGTYRIRSVGGGLYAVSELDPSKMPALEEDVLMAADGDPEAPSGNGPDRR